VRIAGQLIDAASGAHLWADRFEGDLTDIFWLQDQVTGSVVGAIEPKVRMAEIERALRKPTDNLEPYDFLLRGRWAYDHGTKDSCEEAVRLYRRAIAIDPNYARAYAYLARALYALAANHWTEPSEDELAEYVALARTAIRLGPGDTDTLRLAAHTIALPGGELAEGIEIIDRALAQNPYSAETLAMSGNLRAYAGDTEMAFRHLTEADRLNPPGVMVDLKWLGFAMACFVDGDYAGVLQWTAQALNVYSAAVVSLRYRTAALALLGRFDEAHQAVNQLLALIPELTISRVRRFVEVAMKSAFKRPGVVEAYYEGLRLAGLPE
jgi:tetratricopeptide (TPR) repeat protein